jgi:NADPH:quinone reductase-like Zn-dependent oxidoreductase
MAKLNRSQASSPTIPLPLRTLLISQTTSSQRHRECLDLVMRAIRFEVFGDHSVLELTEVPTPAADENTAVVRVMAASINPSDIKNVPGGMKQTTLPRIPGRDFSDVVEAGPAEWIGAEVWGTGGDARRYPRARGATLAG